MWSPPECHRDLFIRRCRDSPDWGIRMPWINIQMHGSRMQGRWLPLWRILMRSMKARAVVSVLVLVMVMSVSAGTRLASAVDPPAATVKVWDTATPIPPSISLGMTPGESVEDPDGLTGHGTSFPTVVTVYARGTNPGGPSGVSYWNPEGNVFVWYGKTMPGGYSLTMPVPPSSGFPGGVDINRGGGPVLAGGPCGASFGAGDVWVGGQQNEPLYVHLAGTDCFRSYATDNGLLPPTSQVFGVEVDEASGDVFLAQPWEGRISRVHPPTAEATVWNFAGSCGSGGASCGNPSYVTIDPAGRPYATVTSSVFGDGIVRVSLGADGILGTADDRISIWPIRARPTFIRPHLFMSESEQIPNRIITADANGNIWFSESNSGKIGRLSGNEICEYTTPGLSNPQQIVTVGSGDQLQVVFTEGNGNSVSVLTQAEADQASFPNRVCTIVAAQTFSTPVVKVIPGCSTRRCLPCGRRSSPLCTRSRRWAGRGSSGSRRCPIHCCLSMGRRSGMPVTGSHRA